MAAEAVRFHGHIIMTFVAKLFLVRMTVQAGILKAYRELFPRGIRIDTIPVTHNRIPPVVQKLHMFCAHKFFRLNAFLLGKLLYDRRVQFRLGPRIGLSQIVIKRECKKSQKHYKARYNLSSVIHDQLPSFPGSGSPRKSVSRSFSPFITRALATSSWTPVTRVPGTQ